MLRQRLKPGATPHPDILFFAFNGQLKNFNHPGGNHIIAAAMIPITVTINVTVTKSNVTLSQIKPTRSRHTGAA